MNQPSAWSAKQRLLRFFGALVGAIAGVALLAFALDYGVLRVREGTNQSAYGSVVVNHYTAVLLKNGKTTLTFDPPQPWTCVTRCFRIRDGCLAGTSAGIRTSARISDGLR